MSVFLRLSGNGAPSREGRGGARKRKNESSPSVCVMLFEGLCSRKNRFTACPDWVYRCSIGRVCSTLQGTWQKFVDFEWKNVAAADLLQVTQTEGQVSWLPQP